MMLQNLLPNSLPPGFSCTVLQEGIGSVTLTPQSGATLQTPDAYTQISDQYGAVELCVRSNPDAASADWRAWGDLGPGPS